MGRGQVVEAATIASFERLRVAILPDREERPGALRRLQIGVCRRPRGKEQIIDIVGVVLGRSLVEPLGRQNVGSHPLYDGAIN